MFLITVVAAGKRFRKGAELVYSRRVSVRHLKSTLKRAEALGKRYLLGLEYAWTVNVRVRLDGRQYNQFSVLRDDDGNVAGVRDLYADGFAHKDDLIKKSQGGS